MVNVLIMVNYGNYGKWFKILTKYELVLPIIIVEVFDDFHCTSNNFIMSIIFYIYIEMCL